MENPNPENQVPSTTEPLNKKTESPAPPSEAAVDKTKPAPTPMGFGVVPRPEQSREEGGAEGLPMNPTGNVGPPPSAPPVDPAQIALETREVLDHLLRHLGFEVKMESEIEKDTLRFQLECKDPGRLIGRRGSTINELQFLLNRILQRRHPVVPRIFLDVEGPMQEAPSSTGRPPSPYLPSTAPALKNGGTAAPRAPESKEGKEPAKPEAPKVEPPKQSPHQILSQKIKALRDQVHRWGEPVDAGFLTPEEREIARTTIARDPEVELASMEPSADPAKPQRMQLRLKN